MMKMIHIIKEYSNLEEASSKFIIRYSMFLTILVCIFIAISY
jgi:hypothetical protein